MCGGSAISREGGGGSKSQVGGGQTRSKDVSREKFNARLSSVSESRGEKRIVPRSSPGFS